MQGARVLHTPSLKACWRVLCLVAKSWLADYAPSMGAALAYYTMFSLAPLLLIVVSVAGLVFGEDAARGEISAQLGALMGARSAAALQDVLSSVKQPGQDASFSFLGLVLLIAGATTVFGELQDALDRIWRVPSSIARSGWITLLRTRLLSFGMVLAIGFLLLVSLVASTALALLGRWGAPLFHGWYALAATANALGSLVLVAVMFALIYKVMPRARVQWFDVWIGAGFTAALFILGKFAIGWYVGQCDVASGFGAAGSLLVVLLWVYYSAQIFLIGAEFTWVYANTYGSRRPAITASKPIGWPATALIGPSADAVAIAAKRFP
jgi:membrane protein